MNDTNSNIPTFMKGNYDEFMKLSEALSYAHATLMDKVKDFRKNDLDEIAEKIEKRAKILADLRLSLWKV